MQRHGDEVDLTTDEARSGSTPHIVRYVLLISLFLAAAAMTIVWVTGALNSDQVREIKPAPRSQPAAAPPAPVEAMDAEVVQDGAAAANLAGELPAEPLTEAPAAKAD